MTASETSAEDYLAGETAATFNWLVYIRDLARRLFPTAKTVGELDQLWKAALALPEFRRKVTRFDPLLFGLIYTPHLIKADANMPVHEQGNITFAELHLELCRYARRRWVKRAGPRESRTAFIAPRGCGKSTWLFTILPIWALAHAHINFIAAFSSAGPQATKHLSAIKQEFDTNEVLRADFPDLCNAMKRAGGQNVADTQKMYFSRSQQTFFAAGLDEEILGLTDPRKRRPELIILDDIEPDESNYSLAQVQKRMVSLRDTILPMNENAHVALVGTVTMPGSLVHQLVQVATQGESPPEWIETERFTIHYFAPIIEDEKGNKRSIWPAKWPLSYLESIQHTRGFKKNFENQPVPEDSPYWNFDTFRYGSFRCWKTIIQIDPATTRTSTSDYYGVAVIGYVPPKRNKEGKIEELGKCLVRYARARRISPGQLRRWVLDLIVQYEEVGRVRIETNQGGDTWKEILKDLPVPLIVHTESIKKDLRAQDLVTHYDRGQVYHETRLNEAEMQMMAFPNVVHDDLVDAIGAGVRFFLTRRKKRGGARMSSYV